MEKNNNSKVYFPNLNGLRFIAAFIVLVNHLHQSLYSIGYYGAKSLPIIFPGELGVRLFFVLSGFLITYLLLTEENNTGTISIKDFYIRRILRIWPLYYALVLLAFFVLPNISLLYIPELTAGYSRFYFLLYLLFLPNILHYYGVVVPYLSQTWSVGVEEQFYLIWPILMKVFRKKIVLFFSVIIIYLGIKHIGFRFRFIEHFIGWNSALGIIKVFWYSFKITAMAIGGIFAYILYKKSMILKYINNNISFGIALILTFCITIFIPQMPLGIEVYSILFGIIIINMAANKKFSKALENKILNYLGKISYGIYMYHAIACVLCIRLFDYFGILRHQSWFGMILLLIMTLLITVLIAGLSYRFMESKFISMKTKFSKIISGDNATK